MYGREPINLSTLSTGRIGVAVRFLLRRLTCLYPKLVDHLLHSYSDKKLTVFLYPSTLICFEGDSRQTHPC